MNFKFNISATVVLYKDNLDILKNTINSFLNTPLQKKLFLIDNSPTQKLKDHFLHVDIEYIHNSKNLGFGAAHNLVLNKIRHTSKYHLLLNPDVSFKPSVILNLIKVIEKEEKLAMVAPKVLFPNGKHQYTCRRYPSILELFVRRSGLLKHLFKSLIKKGEYADKNLTNPFYAEYLTGCFQLYKTNDFIKINGFDERYFLYMEDVDICRKIDAMGKKKLYFPDEQITHILKKGSSKNIRLFFIHLNSSLKYFKKWGF